MNRERLLKPPLLLAALLLAAVAMPAGAEDGGALLRLGERLERTSAEAVYAVEVDPRSIEAAEWVELELPGGRRARVVRSGLELRGGGDLLWTGRTGLGERVVLTVAGGRLAGSVFGSEHGYSIFPHGAGGHRLLEIDAGSRPACGGAPLAGPSTEGRELRARLAAAGRSATAHRTPRFDLLVVYATETTAAVGSKRNMVAVVRHYVDLTNVAFHNSGISGRVRLVHATEAPLPGDVAGDHARILDWAAGSAAIADLRAAHGADLVGVVYERGEGVCGSAGMIYRPGGPTLSRAFFVSRRLCGADTFAHEVGHLLGADHDPDNAVVASGEYIYGRGHLYAGRYRTLMSYATTCGEPCPSQPFFSNPAVRYDRRATGVRDERDNARIINEFAQEIESFADEVVDPGCARSPGDRDYCLECGPCRAGEGNCEGDSECGSGLRCAPDAGAEFGFPGGVNVCRAVGGCDLELGDPDYCRLCGPCGFGAGDCDDARECQAGLLCIDDVGATFGLPPSADVCGFRAGGFCPLEPGDRDFCAACGPCAPGEGSCQSDDECAGFATCFEDVGAEFGFRASAGVCLLAPPSSCALAPGSPDYCRLCGTCELGEGDCDGDRECRAGLSCVDGAGAALGFGEAIDVCLEGGGSGALEAPKRLKARVLPSSRVRLKWKDKSRNEDGFHVEMRVEDGPFERVATSAANKRRLFVGGLVSGTTYTFRVQAFNGAGVSAYSNERTVTLP